MMEVGVGLDASKQTNHQGAAAIPTSLPLKIGLKKIS